MSSDYVRVYHPTGNAWQDVPKGDADNWKASGWLKTKPAHVDDSGAGAPAAHFVAQPVVVPTPAAPESPKADKA